MNDTTPVQQAARLVGIVFLLVGIAGFIPGITTNLYDGLEFAGDGSEAELFGLFQVSILHKTSSTPSSLSASSWLRRRREPGRTCSGAARSTSCSS